MRGSCFQSGSCPGNIKCRSAAQVFVPYAGKLFSIKWKMMGKIFVSFMEVFVPYAGKLFSIIPNISYDERLKQSFSSPMRGSCFQSFCGASLPIEWARMFSSPMRGSCFQSGDEMISESKIKKVFVPYAGKLFSIKWKNLCTVKGSGLFSSPMRGSCFQSTCRLSRLPARRTYSFRPLCGEAVFNA